MTSIYAWKLGFYIFKTDIIISKSDEFFFKYFV